MPLFEQKKQSIPSNLLKDKYGWPPFSVINTISFDWQRRKDEWEVLFTDSTAGRDVKRYNATPTNTFSARGADAKKAESISEFDPYLAELMYRWFSREGDTIIDPFSGGCVRGVVASVLGRDYIGVDLNKTQVDTNKSQFCNLQERYTNLAGTALWHYGDSDEYLKRFSYANMIFTCPPYYNLEQYTNDPRDLSRQQTYEDFLVKYTSILYKASQLLQDNSFFVIVVSEVREEPRGIEKSNFVGLVPDTIHILRDICSLHYYNEIIIMNNIGSLPIRAPKYFDQSRKIGRMHQNCLVFYKGDLSKIEEKFGKLQE
jgi:DNA modification methylase